MLKLGLTWRDIFSAVAAPGLLLAPMLLFTVSDPGRSFSGSRMMRRRARRELQRERRKEAAAAAEAASAAAAAGSKAEAEAVKAGKRDVATSATLATSATMVESDAVAASSSGASAVPLGSTDHYHRGRNLADNDDEEGDMISAGEGGVEVLEKGQEGAIDVALTASRVLAASAASAAVKAARQQPAVMRQPKLRTQIRSAAKVAKVRPMVMRRDGPATTLPLRPADRIDQAMLECLKSRAFLAVTGAAMLNDLGGWSLIAFQSAFYERTFDLEPSVYNPMLAWIIPLSGVIGGMGGGWLCDKLGVSAPRSGRRWLLTGSSLLSAPLIAASLLAPDYRLSLLFLFPGFALSEVFRAPTAVMTRETAPSSPSVAAACHLACRNLVAGGGDGALHFTSSNEPLPPPPTVDTSISRHRRRRLQLPPFHIPHHQHHLDRV